MADPSAPNHNEHLRAIVDMGSNGIRFSISDLTPQTARIMPSLYADRIGISLYDAQWSTGTKQPIPDSVTADIIRSLKRFKSTCRDFGVADDHVRIVATEATRAAVNSQEYRDAIEAAVGWKVEMLPKEDEGRVGAMGVASSFSSVRGLMMDLGGGSTQITWLIAENGDVQMSEAGSVSMPYGAAALSRRLDEANAAGSAATDALRDEITTNLKAAVQTIAIPQSMLDASNSPAGLNLYLSGGGFRGWGFLLMSQHPVSPYPIPVINGFQTTVENFYNTEMIKTAAASEEDHFRVSDRRAGQVPAVALLVGCLLEALPAIKTVRFAQGGVREGSFYLNLDRSVREQDPLAVATRPYASSSSSLLLRLLQSATPSMHVAKHALHFQSSEDDATGVADPSRPISTSHLTALAQSLYIHNGFSKDLQAAAALRSTTTGHLAAIHGADHTDRAILALMLCERWGGSGALSPADLSFHSKLVTLLGAAIAWWCFYFGRIAAVLGEVYPAGLVRPHEEKVVVSSKFKKDGEAIAITVDFGKDEQGMVRSLGVAGALGKLEKLGKKKKWPVVGEGGRKIDLEVKSEAGSLDDEKGGDDD